MLAAMSQLREQFVRDLPLLVKLVYEQYQLAISNEDWREVCDLPVGLKDSELEPLLETRILNVSRDAAWDDDPMINSRVYLSPAWDEEHGLYFAFEDDEWQQVDC